MEKLIRFDWAIKKLLRNKANFDILEGFLSAMFGEDVIVKHVLESEGNQEDETDKFNRVDLLVQNARQELILIEVQVQAEYDFFQRLAYGVSKLITEYIEQGQAYKDIKKVICVGVTYFNLGIGDDYLYYGSTQFTGVHTHDTLALTEKQFKLFGTREIHKIFRPVQMN
jgi:predicted transposase/invertase (TIGR01784 family)